MKMNRQPQQFRPLFNSDESEGFIARFRSAYCWVLGLVIGMTLLSAITLGLSGTTLRNGDHLINDSGRQRMLSQRIAKHALQMHVTADAGDEAAFLLHRKQLADDLSEFESAHHSIKKLRPSTAVMLQTKTKSARLMQKLEPRRAGLTAATLALLAEPSDTLLSDSDRRVELVNGIVDEANHFLPRMHALVNAFESELSTTRSLALAFNLLIGMITLAILGTGMVFVLEPARRQMLRQHRALSEAMASSERAAREVQMLRTALDEHSIVSIADVHGTIVDVNAGFCAISGYSEEELIGQNHRMLNSGRHGPEFWRDMWRTISSGKAWRGEVCNTAKDGSEYWVDSTIVPCMNADGKPEHYVSIRFDVTATKRAFSELKDAQDLLAKTGRAARIGGWELDMDSQHPVWSDEVCRIHEVPLRHVPSLDEAISYYAEEARPVIRAAVARSAESGVGWDLELPFVTAKGNKRWVRALGTPEMRDGVCVKLWGALQDITEVVETRKRLEEIRRRYERTTSGATDGLWEYDVAEGRLWCSDQLKRMLGLTTKPDDAAGIDTESFSMLIHPDDRQTEAAAMREHLSQGTPYNVKYRAKSASGEYRWFNSRGQATQKDDGSGLLMSGSLADINAAHTAQTRLDLATRAARIGLWDWDLETDSVIFNDTYGTMLGYDPGELRGHLDTWKQIVHPEDKDEANARVEQALSSSTNMTYSNEFRCRCKDGTWRWIRAEGEIVERAPDGSPKRMIGVHVDIQDLREAMRRAHAASKEKSEFLANMSHEIRTPMTSILGYADLLEESTRELPHLQCHAQTIHRNAEHLTTIINDILDVSKIEAGKLKTESIAFSLRQVVDDVAGFLLPRAESKTISLQVEYESAIPENVQGDPLRLRQILVNLVGNAVKFTEEGGVVIAVSYDSTDETARIAVRDTGIGMTPALLHVIKKFEAFNQADSSTSRLYGGTGLGLRISKSLSELLGGRLEVESQAGIGSEFTVTIPLYDPDSADRLSSSSGLITPLTTETGTGHDPTRQELSCVRVLLAEDGPDNQRLLRHLLESRGATVEIVDTGEAAVRRLTDTNAGPRPDIVLMDMQMPVLDGFDATRQLRADGYDGPIIAATADAMDGVREDCLAAGCDDYLTKPINKAALFKACTKWARIACVSRSIDAA